MDAISDFNTKKEEIISLINASPVDSEGKKNALNHINMFFKSVNTVVAQPILISENIHFYKNVEGSNEKTTIGLEGRFLPLRPRTPIKIKKTIGQRFQVAIIDIHGDLAQYESTIGYIDNKAKIGSEQPRNLIEQVDERDL